LTLGFEGMTFNLSSFLQVLVIVKLMFLLGQEHSTIWNNLGLNELISLSLYNYYLKSNFYFIFSYNSLHFAAEELKQVAAARFIAY
jgi:hypothetical protein